MPCSESSRQKLRRRASPSWGPRSLSHRTHHRVQRCNLPRRLDGRATSRRARSPFRMGRRPRRRHPSHRPHRRHRPRRMRPSSAPSPARRARCSTPRRHPHHRSSERGSATIARRRRFELCSSCGADWSRLITGIYGARVSHGWPCPRSSAGCDLNRLDLPPRQAMAGRRVRRPELSRRLAGGRARFRPTHLRRACGGRWIRARRLGDSHRGGHLAPACFRRNEFHGRLVEIPEPGCVRYRTSPESHPPESCSIRMGSTSEGRRTTSIPPTISFNGTNYLVAWAGGERGGRYHIDGARVTPAGAVLDPQGIEIASGPKAVTHPAVASDGNDYLVAWADARFGCCSVFGARVGAGGNVLGPAAIAIATRGREQVDPVIAYGGSNYVVAWEDNRSSTPDIYGARVTRAGRVLEPRGILLSTAPLRCLVPKVIGFRVAAAKRRIRLAHCSVGRVRARRSARIGRVVAQSPRPGVERRLGFPVGLVRGRR